MKLNFAAVVALMAAVSLASPTLDVADPAYMNELVARKQGKKKPHNHKHRVQDFRTACNCGPAQCPGAIIKNKKSQCQCENSWTQMCYLRSNGGCPKPSTKAC